MENEDGLKVKDLIVLLQSLPLDAEVFINGEVGWYPLVQDDVEFSHVYKIWHSDYNGNHTPYEAYDLEPRDFVYPREPYMGHSRPDYVCKTVGESDIVILG